MRDANRLRVVDAAMRVAEPTYAITRSFPVDERHGLTSQMRRAAVSIGSNIAEGCGHSTAKQTCSFLRIAVASASELEFQARLAERLHLGSVEALRALREELEGAKRMLAGLIRYLTPSDRGLVRTPSSGAGRARSREARSAERPE